ncbi:hypothetical protein E2C01_064100 [Portunus trituberculatus]|nr:hypothetical protein [Portunus trituberculatus]
MLPRWF